MESVSTNLEPDPQMCRQIVGDEIDRLRLLCDRPILSRRHCLGIRAGICALLFDGLFVAAALLVWWNHRKQLRAAGVKLSQYMRITRAELHRAFERMHPHEQKLPAPATSPNARALAEYRDLFEPL